MHVVHDGPRQAPPLLLVHGSGAAGASWGLMVPALAAHHHVIRVDLPGCGQSPPVASYDVPGQADRVARVLDGLGGGPVVVAGHSSGGYIGTALAERRPDLVTGIALVSTGPSLDALLPQPLALRVLLGPPLGPLVWSLRSDAWVRKGASVTAAHPVEVPDDMVAAVRGITYRTMRAVLRGNNAYIAERSVPERIAALGVPTLVICGAADRKWDPAAARRYDTVPNARLEMLPDVGHVPILEAPDATARLLLEFAAAA